MPLFTYVCRKCQATSELLLIGAAKPVCPKCGSKDIVKQAAAISPRMGSGGGDAGGHNCQGCCSRGSCPNSM